MLNLFCEALIAFVLSFVFIYTSVFVFDAVFAEEKEDSFSFERFIEKIRKRM